MSITESVGIKTGLAPSVITNAADINAASHPLEQLSTKINDRITVRADSHRRMEHLMKSPFSTKASDLNVLTSKHFSTTSGTLLRKRLGKQ